MHTLAQKTHNLSKQLSFLKALYISLFFSFPAFSNEVVRCSESFSENTLDIENTQILWMSFLKAQQFVEELEIKTRKEFLKFAASEDRPKDFPANPSTIYKEWTDWNDFLGTTDTEIANNRPLSSVVTEDPPETRQEHKKNNPQRISATSNGKIRKNTTETDNTRSEEWMSFQEAKILIRRLRIRSQREFNRWKKSRIRPHNFPPNPHIIYKKDWISLGEFLGITRIRTITSGWMSFHQAKEFIKTQGITSSTEFNKWRESGKKPYNFPSNPRTTYSQNWEGWEDFLGTTNTPRTRTKKEWMPFHEAKAFIQNQGIISVTKFQEWSKSKLRPHNFPSKPHVIYKEEWNGWNDFLGTTSTPRTRTYTRTRTRTKKEWMFFLEAKAFIQNQGIISSTAFHEWSKLKLRPHNFPSKPHVIYKEEWNGWKDFLGTTNTPRTRTTEWMPFLEAKAFIQNQGITSELQFRKWRKTGKKPHNFPATPHSVYKEDWSGWGDFLGTGNTHSKEWMPFLEAKAFIQTQGITLVSEFYKWKKSDKKPHNFPATPHSVYKEEWNGWKDFLGTTNMPRTRTTEWMPFLEAKAFIQNQGITSEPQFRKWRKDGLHPHNFPANPDRVYIKEWSSWGDFLGTGKKKNTKQDWISYAEAKEFIQTQGITSAAEFSEWRKSELRPHNFPSNPRTIYKEEWSSWGDFLGTGNTNTKTKEWMPFLEAKAFIQTQGITLVSEFYKWKKSDKKPHNFPATPHSVYKEEWNGWKDFLGTTKK